MQHSPSVFLEDVSLNSEGPQFLCFTNLWPSKDTKGKSSGKEFPSHQQANLWAPKPHAANWSQGLNIGSDIQGKKVQQCCLLQVCLSGLHRAGLKVTATCEWSLSCAWGRVDISKEAGAFWAPATHLALLETRLEAVSQSIALNSMFPHCGRNRTGGSRLGPHTCQGTEHLPACCLAGKQGTAQPPNPFLDGWMHLHCIWLFSVSPLAQL